MISRPARRTLFVAGFVACSSVLALGACSGGSGSATESGAAPSSTTSPLGSTTPGPTDGDEGGALASLPEIDSFRDSPSDQFLIDLNQMTGGHPFKGSNAKTPHPGAHAYVNNASGEWPRGGTGPDSYPAVRAVADGIVTRVITSTPDGTNDRYGIHLAVARSGTAAYEFEYRLEPMVPEPAPGFYAGFITVTEGDRVTKGQVIGHLYLPAADTGSHIHFAIVNTATGGAMAPAIFGREVLREFYARWKATGFDAAEGYTDPIPPCMGWKLAAAENPFEALATECLQ